MTGPKNRVARKKAVAPVWVIVTSQEKLDEVVAAIDSKRVELAKLQDRFKYHIDLAPADIREVATRRVLAKNADGEKVLRAMFAEHQGLLNASCRLERTTRQREITANDFVQFYPYLPHYIELSIDIVSGVRLQPGAPKHLGGSNRTIIKQAYEMLVNPRTMLADQQAGTLVTLDKIYELVEGNLGAEKQKDISDITRRFADGDDGGWTARTAKAICLLEFVRDLPRTPANIAAVLVDALGQPKPQHEVEGALERLEAAEFVRSTDEGYKLQTALEKNWAAERKGYLDPKPKDRNEITREVIKEIFSDPKLKTYRYGDIRSFPVGVTVDGARLGDDGSIAFHVLLADDDSDRKPKSDEALDQSRHLTHQNDLYWVTALTTEIDGLVAQLHASRVMVSKYDQLRSQSRITNDETASLGQEKHEGSRLQSRLREKLATALLAGTGYFRGVAKDGSDLGKTFPDAFKQFLDHAAPHLYPKLRMGARSLKGSEAEEVLKAANLSALSPVFYGGDQGLHLVTQEGAKYVAHANAPVAKEVLDYLNREYSFGNKSTGKSIEDHFSATPYGWDRDLLRLVLAVLLRAGAVEVTHGGRRYRSHTDPQSRTPFTNNPAFRSATFTPRTTTGLKTLIAAAQHFESLTGDEVDVEEAAIAAAFKTLAGEELKTLLPLEATMRANGFSSLLSQISDYRATLENVTNAESDVCVDLLAGEGTSFKESRDRIRIVRHGMDDHGIERIQAARVVLRQMWPVLAARPDVTEALKKDHAALVEATQADDFYVRLQEISTRSAAIALAYSEVYTQRHEARTSAYNQALDELTEHPEVVALAPEVQAFQLEPLQGRACPSFDLPSGGLTCTACMATVGQMESDLEALGSLVAKVLARAKELAPAPDVVPSSTSPRDGRAPTRVRLADFFTDSLDTEIAISAALERLRERLLSLVNDGLLIEVE